ncbi:MAG: HAMP domain-containing histidine kinase [Anaerolineae bacterium]|nr:HAMP domain-containing histidine kinase [Anaerolineae bacterium]
MLTQVTPGLFDKIGWRLGRWLIVALAPLVLGVFRPPEIWQLIRPFWPLLLAVLLGPELARLWPPTRPLVTIISIISDVVLAAMLTLGLDQIFVLLYAPLIVASCSVAIWHVPLWLSLIAIGLNVIIFFPIVTNPQPLPLIVTRSLAFILIGAITGAVGHRLAGEVTLRTELEKKAETRSDRFLMRAHEIRTPLTLIQTSVELILDGAPGPLTEQQRTFLENIDENSRYIAAQAENMLTQGKLESGVFKPSFHPTDIRDIIRLVVADMRTLATRRKQDIRTYYPQVLPTVHADPVLLRQTMINLIQNAIRHTSSQGQIIVSVAKNDLGLLVSVTDDGAGMSVEQRQQLFRRFATEGKGTGLGLLIVKQIAELHGGKVYVDTSLGQGTTFFMSLPFAGQPTEE